MNIKNFTVGISAVVVFSDDLLDFYIFNLDVLVCLNKGY